MTLQVLFANNAGTTLAAPITNTQTSISVTSGTGALFPAPGAGQFFSLTISVSGTPTTLEIVYCTARSGDTLTVARAQEGTTALAFNAGDNAQNLLTAGDLAFFNQKSLLNVQAFATSGAHTYTPTPGMKTVIIECQGGGAAGGGASSATSGNVSMGAPGTSGAYAKGIFTAATIGASQSVTVGAGGAGVVGLSGGNGGTSSVGTIVTSPGGIGGNLAGAVTPPFLNANGSNTAASAGGNIFSALGVTGGVSIATSTATLSSGFGGPSLFGPGPPITQVNQTGASASSFGAGGGPALMNSSGGPLPGGGGGTGIIIFWEYS